MNGRRLATPRTLRLIFVAALIAVGIGLSPIVQTIPTAEGQTGAGGAMALGPGPHTVQGFVRVVDGDTIDVQIRDARGQSQRVAIGLVGVQAPQGNTDCGRQATQALRTLVRGGLRLEEDTTIAVDGRNRRMFRGLTFDNRVIAHEQIQAGNVRWDGRGDRGPELAAAENVTRTAARGCVWQQGEPPKDLRGPRLAETDQRARKTLDPPPSPVRSSITDSLLGLVGGLGSFDLLNVPSAQAQTTLPPQFVQDVVIGAGLAEPTNFAFLPDGRILITEKTGRVRVFKNGALLPTPMLDITDRTNDYFDRGLLGIAVDPDFPNNGYIYLLHTYEDDPNVYTGGKSSRLARYTVQGDVALPASEFPLLGHYVGGGCPFPTTFDCIPSDGFSHSIGNVVFAPDGSLFVTTGDAASFSVVDPLALRAQDLTSLAGKLLHIDKNGNGFTTNPFYNGDVTANRSKVWDYGLRNPYRFALRPVTNVPYIGQVGWNAWEDIYVGLPGRNFGWPCYEGNFQQGGYSSFSTCQSLYASGTRTSPFLTYQHSGGGSAITAGFFYSATQFPPPYEGLFFYGDYGHSWIRTLQADANNVLVPGSVTDFVDEGGADGPVAIAQGPEGYLYYIAINTNQLRRIRFTDPGSPPTVAASSDRTNGLLPLGVQFSSAGTTDPNNRPLTYSWDFGDGSPVSTSPNPSHAYTTAGTYTATLTVTNNVPASASQSIVITAGSMPPTATISTPSSSLLYKVNDVVNFAGSATDWDGTPLPASSLDWQVIAHHCPQGSCHTHFLQTLTGAASGNFTVPDHGDDVYLEIKLNATNPAGLKDEDAVSINPQLVTLTFQSVPTGMQIVYDGEAGTTPRTQQTVINSTHALFAPSPQAQGQASFASWSDGGAQQHNITVGATNATYTATFNATAPTNRSVNLGTSGYVDTLVQEPLNIVGDWTLEAWFRDENPAGFNHDFAYIAMKGDSNQAGEAPYLMLVGYNQLMAGQRTNFQSYFGGFNLVSEGFSPTAWHHAAAVFRAANNSLTVYLDGNQKSVDTLAAHTPSGNGLPLSIGRNGTTGNDWQGKIDDVRVWNVARTTAEVQASFAQQYIGAPTGLVGNWRFDEASGTTTTDSAGLATGTLHGATFSTDVHGAPAPPTTATATPTAGSPTATSTPVVGAQTITFDDPGATVNGQYPIGVIDWGTNRWIMSGPYGAFTTASIGFNGVGPTTAPFTFLTPKRLIQVAAFNGGTVTSNVSASCVGQTTAQIALAAGQQAILNTNWTAICSPVTIGSSNGWDTNFDNFMIDDGPAGTATPSFTPTATNTPMATLSPSATNTPGTPTATNTPGGPTATTPPTATQTSTSTATSTNTSTPTRTLTPTATSTPAVYPTQTITFDDLANPNRVLSGQYPTGVIDWGSVPPSQPAWYLAAPFPGYQTNSVGFDRNGPTSLSFTFVSPKRLVQFTAINDGSTSSTVTASCAGQPTASVLVNAHTQATLVTNWVAACSPVTLGSSNSWNTNFDTLVVDDGGAGGNSGPTATPGTPTATFTPGTPTASATATATLVPPAAGSQTITFDDLTSGNRALSGQYPTGVIDWGTSRWWLAGPFGAFTTMSVGFNGPSSPVGAPRSESITFISLKRLVQIDLFNGGTAQSTITVSCAGLPTASVVALPSQRINAFGTGWASTCSPVTIGSTNGWDTNFDNFVIDDGLSPAVSAVQATPVTTFGGTIAWTTDRPANSQVEYGTSTAYGSSTPLDSTMITSHSMPLNGLSPGTTYHYRIKTADSQGNLTTTADFSFLTTSTACVAPVTNPIACENSRQGNPSLEWDILSGADGDPSIQGYATDISVNKGDTVRFKISSSASAYRLDIYRMGYYQGNGARKITTLMPSATLPQTQPACLLNASVGLVDCGNWAQSASWAVPTDAVSGIYFAKLVRSDTAGASHIYFIVRDDTSNSPVLFQTSDPTWQAYNSYGGASLYYDTTTLPLGAHRAFKVSYNRPFNTRASINGFGPRSFVWDAEYPMVRWLEANGYNVSYFSGVDTDRRGNLITNHRAFLSVGHDEYWSAGQRANVEAARNAGVNLAFFSGNTMFWKTRWENSIDGSGTPYRTLVTYKETLASGVIDPADPPTWTGTWRDPRFSPPGDAGRPENALTGNLFMMNGPRADTMTATGAFRQLRFWRNTAVANLAPSGSLALSPGSLGHEWGEDLDNGFRPAGLIRLSATTIAITSGNWYLQDYGATFGTGTGTHSMTLYRHASGALVFGTSFTRWSWGLDSNHDSGTSTVDQNMRQATVNLFADMGVQPGTLQAGLVAATASTDTTRPASTISAPTNGASLPRSVAFTISGTATDTGGVVGGVEVSVDGGTTWRRATGLGSWTYSWTPTTAGPYTIRSRAVDDTGNLETPSAGVAVTVT